MGQALSSGNRRSRRNVPTPEASKDKPPTNESHWEQIPDDSKVIDGRLFKKSGSPVYPLPNDKSEFGRLNVQHYIVRYIFQSNYQAPVTEDLKRGIRVLDVGCGTGVWSIDLANDFPNSTFTGTDITNVFSAALDNAPPNCTFLEADTTQGLPFPDNTFDFVFQRAQTLCFPKKIWPSVLQELVRVCKPGGFVELLEGKFAFDCGPALAKHAAWVETLLSLRGIDADTFATPELIENAGLVDIKSYYMPWRLNWGPDAKLGEMNAQNYVTIVRNFRPLISTALGVGDDEYDEVEQGCEAELLGPSIDYKARQTLFSHYGRKPALPAPSLDA